MAKQTAILTYLQRIDAKLDLLAADVRDIESSLTLMEHQLRGIGDVLLMVSGTATHEAGSLGRVETA
jgi:hypothetical protein